MRRKGKEMSGVDYPKVVDLLTDTIKELNQPCVAPGPAVPAERTAEERKRDAADVLRALLHEPEGGSAAEAAGAAAESLGLPARYTSGPNQQPRKLDFPYPTLVLPADGGNATAIRFFKYVSPRMNQTRYMYMWNKSNITSEEYFNRVCHDMYGDVRGKTKKITVKDNKNTVVATWDWNLGNQHGNPTYFYQLLPLGYALDGMRKPSASDYKVSFRYDDYNNNKLNGWPEAMPQSVVANLNGWVNPQIMYTLTIG
jgi:hypothetical protein